MPISIASPARRITWDDPETRRRADAVLEERIVDALTRARPYVDVELWEAVHDDEEALDTADVNLEDAVVQLKARLEAPAGLQRGQLLEVCQVAMELQELHREHQERKLSRRLRALNAIQEVLARPQGDASVEKLLERATAEACRSCGFDRAMLFLVNDGTLKVQSTYFRGHDEWAAECHRVAEENPARLEAMLLETEMLRRRAAALMEDPMHDARAFRPIIDKIETSGYAAVPIMPEGKVIATIHADTHFSGRRVDTIDRDVLAAFAAGLGSMLERKVLVERLVAQRDHVRSMLQATDAFITQFCESEIGLEKPVAPPMPSSGVRGVEPDLSLMPPSRAAALLSRREMEVLRLMAGGATNAVIAKQLVLSEGTVKSHVKRILRKLRAANRAEAVSRFLRLEGGVQAVEEAMEGVEL
ncbi:LuxR C-terminal-related transcriptional regulator [Conexibacter sp. SYSU D00693]|uniref:LuxR C-terminal-related transcriptional regulator n=1 Tax=Conexibacter sp. SYSU D00693 TaxID=2812560 RepID=UPI00196A3CE2|nr:LuxR C-terminal-related transcriptional regulator [Conexibacter sp. SYSU D00693]